MRTLKLALSALLICPAAPAQERPNLLWITSEDNGPQLGCYGDDYADHSGYCGYDERRHLLIRILWLS